MILRAPAKINLGLDVLRRREDGYHEVRMVMQMTGMYDRILLTPVSGTGEISFSVNLPYIPANENNLAYRAAKLLMDEFSISDGIRIELQKFIPVAAGLAGGSSDAAQVLIGVNRIFRLGLSTEELMIRGKTIGADVPYCILGGTALAEGIGEILSPLPALPSCSILLAKPNISVSTKEVYKALKADQIGHHPDIDGMLECIRRGELRGVAERMENVLESVTAPAYPVIGELEKAMKEAGALAAIMSGSGPTVFGIFDDEGKAAACRETLGEKIPARLFLTHPNSSGGAGYGN